MEAATLAVVRASRPSFETAHDKLAFAVHAFVLANGFKLVATGAAAEDESADFSVSREEVEPTGWDSQEGTYAFRYQDTEGSRAPLYVKCLAVGSQLLVHWVGASGGKVPLTLELDTAAYTIDAPAAPACYQRTNELVSKLGALLASALDRGASAATTTDRSAVAGQPGSSRAAEREAEPHQEQPGVSGMGHRPPGVPFGIGVNDVVPPGMIPPGYGGGPALPGLMDPRGMRGGGGGMHVGPGDPIFGPGRMGGGVGAPPGHGSLPPGARWDPIAPPGMQGFHPDDFQRPGGGRPHPDMAQPGPGRGADMDYMFG